MEWLCAAAGFGGDDVVAAGVALTYTGGHCEAGGEAAAYC